MGAVKVRVIPYDPRWPARYEEEAARIREILGDQLVAIHHIGSTAVLSAHPSCGRKGLWSIKKRIGGPVSAGLGSLL